ncbi:MAG: glycosyltransferase family 39 protein, partial [Candidatus Helarchaeota archaeon]
MSDKKLVLLLVLIALLIRIPYLNKTSIFPDAYFDITTGNNILLKYFTHEEGFSDNPPLGMYVVSIPSKILRYLLDENDKNLVLGGRIGSLITSLLIIIIAYYLTRKVFNKKTALLFTTSLIISPLLIYYSTIICVDNALVLTSTAYCLITFLTKKEKKYIWYSGTTFPLLYLSKTTSVFILIAMLAFILLYRREVLKKEFKTFVYAYSLGIIILLFLWPYLRTNPYNLINNFLERAEYSSKGHTTYHFGRIHEKAVYWVGPALVLAKIPEAITILIILFILNTIKELRIKKRISEERAFLSLWFFTPLLLIGFVNIIANHYILFLIPPAYLIAAYEFNNAFNKKKNYKIIASIFITLILIKLLYWYELPGLNTVFFLKPEFVSLIPETGYSQTLNYLIKNNITGTISDSYNMGSILGKEIL